MVEHVLPSLESLYEQDETAWLEGMADLIAQRRFHELDHEHLREYLLDMARRDKREVLSCLVVFLAHLLKWEHQTEKRSKSWRLTIVSQRQELEQLLESGTLRRYAAQILGKAYQAARERAIAETELAAEAFPQELTMSLAEVLEQK